jgi:hypothetical protein
MYILIFFYILTVLLITLLYHSLFTWIIKLEKEGCECSNLWQKIYIKIGSILLPSIHLLLIILSIGIRISVLNVYIPKNINNFILLISLISMIIGIIFFAILLNYISILKQKQCKCSESWKREFGYIYSIIYFLSYLCIIFYFAFYSILFNSLILKNKE